MRTSGVHHVAICVDDLDRALEFYVDRLGFPVRADRPDLGDLAGAWLDAGAAQIHLMVLPMPDGRGQHFALGVADLDGTIAELRDRGIEVHGPYEMEGVCRQAFLHDPAGNQVELNQPLT